MSDWRVELGPSMFTPLDTTDQLCSARKVCVTDKYGTSITSITVTHGLAADQSFVYCLCCCRCCCCLLQAREATVVAVATRTRDTVAVATEVR